MIIGSVGATNMNERSSRSHAIFTITVECSEKGPDGQNHVRMGKLHLVDLAVSLFHGGLDWTYSNRNLLYVSRKFHKTVTIIIYIKVLQNTNHMGRAFNTRKKEEYSRNVKIVSKGSRIVNHAWSHNHTLSIDFENASVIDNSGLRTRKTLEAWRTKLTPAVVSDSCPLPGQYNIIFNWQTFIIICITISQFLTFLFKFFPLLVIHISLIKDCSSGS